MKYIKFQSQHLLKNLVLTVRNLAIVSLINVVDCVNVIESESLTLPLCPWVSKNNIDNDTISLLLFRNGSNSNGNGTEEDTLIESGIVIRKMEQAVQSDLLEASFKSEEEFNDFYVPYNIFVDSDYLFDDGGNSISIQNDANSTTTLILRYGNGDETYRESGDYCVRNISSNSTTLSIREANCEDPSNLRPCIQKCCPLEQVLDFDSEFGDTSCKHSNFTWLPKFEDEMMYEENITVRPYIIYLKDFKSKGNRCENHSVYFHEHSADDLQTDGNIELFRILPNGSLSFISEPVTLDPGKFCVDGLQNLGINRPYTGEQTRHISFTECLSEFVVVSNNDSNEYSSHQSMPLQILYLVIIPFATIFIVLTIIVYTLLWNTHNLHGKTLYGYLIAMLGFYIFLFLTRVGLVPVGSTFCAIVAGGFHFFFLSYICWLTAINFDVWYTFKYLKAGPASHNMKRLMLYCMVAFGGPALLVFTSTILDLSFKNDDIIIVPGYGRAHCNISSQKAIAFYLLIPIGLLLVTNIGLFTWTVMILRDYQRSITSILKGTAAQKEDQSYGDINDLKVLRQNSYPLSSGCRQLGIADLVPRVGFGVFLKLFVLTGISWIFDLIGWWSTNATTSEGVHWAFALFDAFNLLLAVAVFFLFVWKQKIYDDLWLRYPRLRCLLKICVLGTCFESPKEKKYSVTGITLSTLGRTGTGTTTISLSGRKISSDLSKTDATASSRKTSMESRKFSQDSRKYSSESRKVSSESGAGVDGVLNSFRTYSLGSGPLSPTGDIALSVVPESAEETEIQTEQSVV